MSREHCVDPDAEHYSCVVDIYSRAGRLDKAYRFIQRMPMGPTAIDWKALLGGCRVYKNVELAKISAKKLFEIDPTALKIMLPYSTFLLLPKMERSFKNQNADERERNYKNSRVCWLHVGNRVHTFGILNFNGQLAIRVFKNLRLCGDCHNAI